MSAETEKIDLAAYEKMQPVVKAHGALWSVPNRQCLWRVSSLTSKEPDTLEWIAAFADDDIMWDVGANVGMYTVIAGVKGNPVFAFEPESQNYATLNRNIGINNLQDRVVAYPLAISDAMSLDRLHLPALVTGGSTNSFGADVDFHLNKRESAFSQGAIAVSLDALVSTFGLQIPQHIKIDVDGIEHKIIAGSAGLLANPALKSVLVELNTHLAEHRAVIAQFESLGFTTSIHPDAIRREGPFAGVGNHIFRRNPAA